ncbi:MAG: hypothetical protein M3209_01585 [Acidobacteriota bacterium]|nr:hypothetical protein [Acidobacteriota bacterium]
MNKKILSLSGSLVLAFSLSGVVSAQDTTATTTTKTTTVRETVKNPDGSYTVIEYPVGKEVTVDLTPLNLQGARGLARIMRSDNGTNVALDLSGLPADAKSYYVYAVDPSGNVSLLGPTTIANGTGTASFTTPMSQFMLVLSPNEGLTTIGNDTPVVFRSAVPQGFAVVGNRPSNPIEETKQVAGSVPVSSVYEVPMLGIPSLGGKDTEIRIQFSGDLQGLKGKAYIDPRQGGATQIKMRFDDMKMAPKNRRFVLWAVSPDKKYTKIGQVINTGQRQEGEIRGETALSDFGLFVTMEETDVMQPSGTVYAPFTVYRP